MLALVQQLGGTGSWAPDESRSWAPYSLDLLIVLTTRPGFGDLLFYWDKTNDEIPILPWVRARGRGAATARGAGGGMMA